MNNAVDKWYVLLVVALFSFLAPFTNSSVDIALPSIGREFAMDAVLLSWVVTSLVLTTTIFLIPFGRIADVHGRKRIYTYGVLIYVASSLLSMISTSAIVLISFRVLQGIGSAMVISTSVAILTSVFPVGKRGKVLGINTATVYLGHSLGPSLGGFLVQHFGWRSIFLANIPLGLIIIALIFWKLKEEWTEAKGEKFDFIGSIIYSIMLTVIICGFSLLPVMSSTWLILIGALGTVAFIKWETRVESPVLDINLFRNNTLFAFSSLAALITYTATYAVTFLLSLYLQHIKGLSPQNAGLILVFHPVVMAIFSPFTGRLSDKIEPRIIASMGMALTVVGLFLFTFLNEKTALEFMVANLILLGFGFALFVSPNTNAIMSSIEKRFYGVASATTGTMRRTGQTFSMGITTLMFTTYIGRVQIVPEYYPLFLRSVKMAFVIFAVICFGGIFASFARGRVLKK